MLNPRISARIKDNRIATLRAKVGRIACTQAPVELAKPSRLAAPVLSESAPFLPGNLPAGCIHEIEGASWDAETGIAASGFAAALLAQAQDGAILWAVRHDTPFAPRLAAFGLEPSRVIFCRCRNDAETLAALEDGLRTQGIAATIGEVENVTLTQSRRLHLICERSGNVGLLLRRRFHGAPASAKLRGSRLEGSAAVTRWRVHFAPTQTSEPGLGPPRWRLDLLYCRGGMPASFIVEWNDEARHLHLVAKLADHQAQPHQSGLRRAG
jgi:protein ImuA